MFRNADWDATSTKMEATINASTNINIISCALNENGRKTSTTTLQTLASVKDVFKHNLENGVRSKCEQHSHKHSRKYEEKQKQSPLKRKSGKN